MAKISKEELLKIAEISKLKLYEQEIPDLLVQIGDVLDYAARVKEITADVDVIYASQINVVREDAVVKTDTAPILANCPDEEQGYFVVPKVIENK